MNLYKEDAVDSLRKVSKKAQKYYATNDETSYGITGSTFRAYRKTGTRPSVVFKEWVTDYSLPKLSELEVRSSRQYFIEIHNQFAASLDNYWHSLCIRDLTTAEKYKIVDLHFKAIPKMKIFSNDNVKNFLIDYANIPLDKFSLLAIKKLFKGIVVCPNPSMGNIEDQETYDFIQDQIYELTSISGLPNLYFDYFAWNTNH